MSYLAPIYIIGGQLYGWMPLYYVHITGAFDFNDINSGATLKKVWVWAGG